MAATAAVTASGPPRGYISPPEAYAPSPPFPAATKIRTSSMNIFRSSSQLLYSRPPANFLPPHKKTALRRLGRHCGLRIDTDLFISLPFPFISHISVDQGE